MEHEKTIVLNAKTASKKPNTVLDKHESCPFCDWSDIITDGLMIDNQGEMAWVKNKFPILEDAYQTLILETNKCGEDLTTYSIDYAQRLFKFIFDCRNKLVKSNKFKEVLFFKNHGQLADSSISHSHSQLVGINHKTYDYKELEESISGPIVFEDVNTKVTVSEVPRHEFYEFNVIFKNTDDFTYVQWVQTLIRYLKEFKGGKINSYNLVYHETQGQHIIKVIPRKPVSVYYIGYGYKQTPNDVSLIAEEIKNFFIRNNKE